MRIKPQNYRFTGSPEAIQAATAAHNAHMGAESQVKAAQAQAAGQGYASQANLLGTLYQQPAQFANAMAQMYGGQMQALAGLGAGMGGVGQGYGAVGQAIGNERSNFYGANAMAEAARQAGLANLGTGALSAYGGAANSAMQTQALQTTGYMKALSDMMAANQGAVAGLGRAQTVAGALGGGGGFNATGVQGPVASGSYGGGGGGGGEGALAMLGSGDAAYRGQLERGFNAQAGVPREMLGDVLTGVRGLYDSGAGNMQSGMNQFYDTQNDPRNRGDYSGVLGGLSGLSRQFGQLAGQTGSGGGLDALMSLWNRSMGQVGAFNPARNRDHISGWL